ncbi:diaminobutyrate acetyltransferase [Polycladomyces sp. WAk]|uniref:L-2,4-diaminobutyric acid acetyltransferase n=1 Tax=Polycladomyces zharkentensis TaxID=2807616 RepID=A0ABS2WLB0_9BACL|nr:diaminobutyrate acetyltransferase [Polycladomyces sp. WAk]MBN2910314.1 diaminobutyrate acetyltransferase [Polycladomyces sp. WAk]
MNLETGLMNKVALRQPQVADGIGIWSLVRDTGVLDVNSPYSYLMLCKFFSDTCVVAEQEGQIVGFLSAFRPPADQQTLFVWQVAVAESQRGNGLGKALLKALIRRDACKNVRYLEATVSPSNLASQALFRGLARDFATCCEVSECFPAHLFPGGTHESEMTFRIGPFRYQT